jgi:hypothetical protein
MEVTVLVALFATTLAAAHEVPSLPEADPYDLGVGLDLGLLPGLKFRATGMVGHHTFIGLDADFTTVILINDVKASVLAGGSWSAGRGLVRSYAALGVGEIVVAPLEPWSSPLVSVGAGVEWKPGPAFGLGLEAGEDVFLHPEGMRGIPYGRLTTTLYVF